MSDIPYECSEAMESLIREAFAAGDHYRPRSSELQAARAEMVRAITATLTAERQRAERVEAALGLLVSQVRPFIDSIESDDAHYSVPMHLALMDAEDALTSPAPLQVGGRRLVPECVHGLPISRDCAECDAGSGTKYASAVEERNVAERLWSDAEARLEALRPMYESAIAARRAWTPTRESNDRIERTASYLVDEVGKALTSTAPPAGVAAGDEPRLTCSECNTTWSAANTKPGDLCGVRISGSWCDGKLAAPTAAGDGGE